MLKGSFPVEKFGGLGTPFYYYDLRLLRLLGLLFAVHALRPFLKASGGLGNAFGERLLRLLALIFLVLLAFSLFLILFFLVIVPIF